MKTPAATTGSASAAAPDIRVKLANPRGFCAGVDRAVDIVERALALFGAPIYVRHEIVHNRRVVASLEAQGAIFVEELEEIPAADSAGRVPTVVFSAHGVARQVRADAAARGFRVFDATCPLVTKVHMEVARASRKGDECVLIGHANHPEVQGTIGNFDRAAGGAIHLVETVEDARRLEVGNPSRLSYVSQTTLSVDDCEQIVEALRERFPRIAGPRKSDICYATQNRQDAVKQLALECELILVVGARNSSNSNRLRDIGERLGCRSHLIDSAAAIDPNWLEGKTRIGVTAGASAPESLVREVVAWLRERRQCRVEELDGIREDIAFNMPAGLRG